MNLYQSTLKFEVPNPCFTLFKKYKENTDWQQGVLFLICLNSLRLKMTYTMRRPFSLKSDIKLNHLVQCFTLSTCLGIEGWDEYTYFNGRMTTVNGQNCCMWLISHYFSSETGHILPFFLNRASKTAWSRLWTKPGLAFSFLLVVLFCGAGVQTHHLAHDRQVLYHWATLLAIFLLCKTYGIYLYYSPLLF